MISIRNNSISKPLVFMLIIAILVTGMGFGYTENAYAASGATISVRIEGAASTKLAPTALNVERFDIAPFITGSLDASYAEPAAIKSAHALIEAVYYENFGTDADINALTSPGGLTAEVVDRIKQDLVITSGGSGFVSISSVYGESDLVMSAINDNFGDGIISDSIASGDRIVYFPWRDANKDSSNYAYFTNSSVSAITDIPVTLTLNKNVWGTILPVTGASILIDGTPSGNTTDSDGTVTLTFDTTGEHIITAEKTSPDAISRPYCKVTVKNELGLSHLDIISPGLWGSTTTNTVPLMDSNNTYVMTVPNSQTTFSAVVIPAGVGVTMSAVYTKAGEAALLPGEIISGASVNYDLAAGNNLLEVTICKGSDVKTYHLTIARQPVLSGLDVSFIGSSETPHSLIFSSTTKLNIADSTITGISATAIQANPNQTIAVKYTKSGSAPSAPAPMTSGIPMLLDSSIGMGNNNTFEFTVTEFGASQTYTLIVSQIGSEAAATTVNTIIDSISGNIATYDSDWVLAMYAAGKSSLITDSEKTKYLKNVLIEGRKDSASMNPGTVAKMIIALTAMGIDPRQVPDANGIPIDLVAKLSTSRTTVGLGDYGIYTAPYILLAYDSGNYTVSSSASLSRSELINYIIGKKDSGNPSWGGGDVDTTAMVLPALAPYLTTSSVMTDEAIIAKASSAAINAVNWLSSQQKSDGSFASWGSTNSNSTSTVILALSALGINADTDARFTKGTISALKDLLSYKTADNRLGLTDTNYNAFATQQGYQALVAYRCLITGSTNGGNLYKFTSPVSLYDKWPESKILTDVLVVSHPAIQAKGAKVTANDLVVKAMYKTESTQELVTLTGGAYTIGDYDYNTAGTKTVPITYEGKTTSFVISVTDPSAPNVEIKKITIVVRGDKGAVLLRNANFAIDENKTTVLDALRSVMAAAGYSVELNSAGTYVERMAGLGELDLGKNSGWMYSVNGETPPTTSAADYLLKNGDLVIWYYTTDFTKDPSSSKWTGTAAGSSAEIFEAKVDSNGTATATITKDDLNKVLTGSKDTLVIDSTVATLTFDKDVMKSIVSEAGKEIKFEIAKADKSKLSEEAKAMIGNRPVYDFTITSGGKTISKLNGKVSVSIPYTPASGESTDSLVVYYVDDSGKLQMVKDCKYDSKNKAIVFSTDHFSRYAIGYCAVSFTDTKGHWSEPNINYLAARGILNGKAEGKFMPNDNITRAEFITILANKSSSAASTSSGGAIASFQDVKSTDWYANAVSWGAQNNIITGSDGRFRPNDKITRQEMAVILDRYTTKFAKITVPSTAKTVSFSDSLDIAAYAKASVEKMQKLGIINGKTAFTFEPTDNATRAESAKMIAVLLQTAIK